MTEKIETSALQATIAVLAIKLFGRERAQPAPSAEFWCLSAVGAGYKSKSSGPWFRYRGEKLWSCELCDTDPYLSEYGDKYLLGPAGMLALIETLREQGHDLALQTRYNGESGCWAQLAKLPAPYMSMHEDGGMHRGNTFPEAVARAAFASLPTGRGGQNG